ncbi:MAG: hypothetical protein JG761_560 [Proteiniphilum sp.]|jgi:hypothetical protein|nr:hypothetical protein [Proteiniphilum sp.]
MKIVLTREVCEVIRGLPAFLLAILQNNYQQLTVKE